MGNALRHRLVWLKQAGSRLRAHLACVTPSPATPMAGSGTGSGRNPLMRTAHAVAALALPVALTLGLVPLALPTHAETPLCKWQGGTQSCPEDCASDGGTALCQRLQGSAYSYDLCDEAPPFLWRENAYCVAVLGGEPMVCSDGYGGCCSKNSRAHLTEQNIGRFAGAFAEELLKSCPGGVGQTSDSNWLLRDAHLQSPQCLGDNFTPRYRGNIETAGGREFQFASFASGPGCGAESIKASRQREAYCPAGYTMRDHADGSVRCVKVPQQSCPSCTGLTEILSGTRRQPELDLPPAYPGGLWLERHYNSQGMHRAPGHESDPPRDFGDHWSSNWHMEVQPGPGSPLLATVRRPDGSYRQFDVSGRDLNPEPGSQERLAVEGSSAAPTGWVYTRSDDTTERFDAAGRLSEVTTRDGYRFTLTRNADGQIDTVRDSFGQSFTFAYGMNKLVESLTTSTGLVYRYHTTLDRLDEVEYPSASPLTAKSHSYGYDSGANYKGANLLAATRDENGNNSPGTHFDGGRVATQVGPLGNAAYRVSPNTSPGGRPQSSELARTFLQLLDPSLKLHHPIRESPQIIGGFSVGLRPYVVAPRTPTAAHRFERAA